MASFGKPITRATAERLLTGLIDRAATWNTDPVRLISIKQLVVFGSYLDPTAERLGDLDIAAIEASGRSFSSLVDRLCWPEDEAQMMLRNRSAAINITIEDIRNLTTRCATGLHPEYLASVRLHPKIASQATLAESAITAS